MARKRLLYHHDPPCDSECCDREIGEEVYMSVEEYEELERKANE